MAPAQPVGAGKSLTAPVIVLDANTLAKLTDRSPKQAWLLALAPGGLLDRTARSEGETEEARLLIELRKTLAVWDTSPPVDLVAHAKGRLKLPWVKFVAIAAVLTMLYSLTQGSIGGLICPLALAPILLPFRPNDPVDAIEALPHARSEHAIRLLQRLLGRSFVTVMDGAVVEHVPHMVLLRSRIVEVDQAEATLRARSAEIETTRLEIVAANEEMGRRGEDAETARLARQILGERAQIAALATVREELRATLQRTEDVLGELRAMAMRAALSMRAARLTAGTAAPARAIADAEVDLAGYGSRLADLAAETRDADARLRGLLER